MDLNDFPPNILPELASAETVQNLSFKEALQYTDQTWSINLGKAARWMDLVGDYAGSEPYVVDGESLLRLTLSDPLLALGQADDPSFQILHAYHSLERFLRNLIIRSANFDVVFWHDNRCGTLRIGDSESQHVVASRMLAHGLLVRHLQKLSEDHEFKVKLFEGLTDPSWTQYEMMKKACFCPFPNALWLIW
ncbi:hypothetical protein VKT23_015796 [Stygiomarasmius scandens]|uniref:ATP-dependent RNA helicase DDX60 PIN-like domain-containing protein n=1 Tax=Marasmiellus scandens TaxID=2682957 RepID=A0ABR1IZX0_9AGAR